jgi:hypothetical protein
VTPAPSEKVKVLIAKWRGRHLALILFLCHSLFVSSKRSCVIPSVAEGPRIFLDRADASQSRAQREPMGKVTSRALEASQYAKNPQNFPPGEYVELKYKTSLDNAPSGEELLQLVKTSDGSWKVGAYFPSQNQQKR